MSKTFTVILFFLLLQTKQISAQQNCSCDWLLNKEQILNDAIESQNENSFKQNLILPDVPTSYCKQEFYYWKAHFFNKFNHLDSFEIYLNLFHSELQIQSCEVNNLKYNYLNGYYYVKRDLYDSASYYFIIAIEQAKKLEQFQFLAKSYIGLGLVFDRIMQPHKSIQYYQQGILLAEKINEDKIKLS